MKITHEGETLSVTEWGRRYRLSPELLRWRLNQGWSTKEALKRPVGSQNKSPYMEARMSVNRAKKVREDFDKLVRSIDRSLRNFNNQLQMVLHDDDGGRPSNLSESSSDRSFSPTQEST